ncbi:MAG: replication-associated recombination protein A [Parcubacteria group bacterium]
MDNSQPLADRMRPVNLGEFVGQEHIISRGKILRRAIEGGSIPSIVFWGPPGSGKTTLAHIIANTTDSNFVRLSGATGGVADIKRTVERAIIDLRLGTKTIIFIDEIHRFNKAQQDRLLPHVEKGIVTFIGATTENPSFEINSALLSRSRVFVLNLLDTKEIETIIKRALADKKRGLGNSKIDISAKTIKYLASMSAGDSRVALNALELAVNTSKGSRGKQLKIDEKMISESLQRTHLLYDRAGDEHYNIISALHKSMRGGNTDASLYWLGRMLEAGEDPLYIARRLVRFASEDIGIANSFALPQAISAYEACHFIGMPECDTALAQAVVYMAKSKKSNALYQAYEKVKKDVRELPNEPVPLHLRNAPTKLMKNLGFGKDYKYTPRYKDKKEAEQDFMPKKLRKRRYLKMT